MEDSPIQIELTQPKPTPMTITPMFSRCYNCELFSICNGCSTNVLQITDRETYCQEMLLLKKDLINYGWVTL